VGVDYVISQADPPAREDVDALIRRLSAFNSQFAGDEQYRPLAFFLRDVDGEMASGISGSTSWNWLAIELLWVRQDLRGQGYGGRLLDAAEQEAVRRGRDRALLDTMSFQAPRFYQERGYTIFGELADFPGGHARFYLTKRLPPLSPR